MKLTLLVMSDKVPKWVDEVCEHYLKRISFPFQVNLVVLPAPKRYEGLPSAKAIKMEAELLLQKIPSNAYCVLLDERGKSYNSVAFSKQLEGWQLQGQPVVLVIGGADGFDDQLYARAQELWSLSPLTFPHPLVRVMVAEQLYRAVSLIKGHPYHRT
jgi:23S rRNA (pseudouridine1915-N3)-methyltransferase